MRVKIDRWRGIKENEEEWRGEERGEEKKRREREASSAGARNPSAERRGLRRAARSRWRAAGRARGSSTWSPTSASSTSRAARPASRAAGAAALPLASPTRSRAAPHRAAPPAPAARLQPAITSTPTFCNLTTNNRPQDTNNRKRRESRRVTNANVNANVNVNVNVSKPESGESRVMKSTRRDERSRTTCEDCPLPAGSFITLRVKRSPYVLRCMPPEKRVQLPLRTHNSRQSRLDWNMLDKSTAVRDFVPLGRFP